MDPEVYRRKRMCREPKSDIDGGMRAVMSSIAVGAGAVSAILAIVLVIMSRLGG